MQVENLLLVVSTNSVDTILKFPLLYGGVSMPRGYWEKVHVMFWGESIDVVAKTKSIQERVLQVQKEGVEFSACVVCAQDYEATKTLEAIGVVCTHTGELLTHALKDESWRVLTI